MRIATLRTHGLPGVTGAEVEIPPGLVAIVAPDGRIRRALARILLGDDEGPGTGLGLLPRVADPVLGRLPDGLLHRLRTGRGLTDADQVVEAGARALAWSRGLDRLEAARSRLARIQAGDGGVPASGAEALLARLRALESTPAELQGLESELRELRGTTSRSRVTSSRPPWNGCVNARMPRRSFRPTATARANSGHVSSN
jgi:hypothetical protein